MNAAPVTASLVLGGAILWMLIALADRDPLGAAAEIVTRPNVDGVRADRDLGAPGLDRLDPVATWSASSSGWTPITGYCDFFNPSTDCGGPVQWAWHMILPWITFAILFAALYVRMIRANVMETSNEDYVRTARAKGAPGARRDPLAHPAQRAAAGRDDAGHGHRCRARRRDLHRDGVLAAGARRRPALQAIPNFDLPTVQGIIVFATLAIIVFNLIVDLLYAVIDPRIRLS